MLRILLVFNICYLKELPKKQQHNNDNNKLLLNKPIYVYRSTLRILKSKICSEWEALLYPDPFSPKFWTHFNKSVCFLQVGVLSQAFFLLSALIWPEPSLEKEGLHAEY